MTGKQLLLRKREAGRPTRSVHARWKSIGTEELSHRVSAFAKETQKTPPHEIALAQKRLKEMLNEES